MEIDSAIIEETKKWINDVVVGCNFCPFAGRELKRGTIHFVVLNTDDSATILDALSVEFERLDNNSGIVTTLLILPGLFPVFSDYLDMFELCENFLTDQEKEGVYQIASFHPDYLFTDSSDDDPANYTNRSLYPMIHLLRESSITAALVNFPNPETIPERNIEFAKQKGLAYMKILREACWAT